VSDFVLDASLALQWFLDDEKDRQYSLEVLDSFTRQRAVVPALWFYEVGSGLLRAYRRKRILLHQVEEFLTELKVLPIDVANVAVEEILQLPALAQKHNLTNYDAAYLAIALRLGLPLATSDSALRRVAANAGVEPFIKNPNPRS
jgi:predicted nucleic acid-binding protein